MRRACQYIPAATAWTPGSDADLALWLDAQSIVGLTNGQAVTTQMADKSTNTYTISTGNSPTYQTSILNGHPAVLFNGTNQWLQAASCAFTEAYTVMCTLTPISGVGLFMEHGPNAGTTNGFYWYGSTGYTNSIVRTGNNAQNASSSSWVGSAATKVITSLTPASGWVMQKDGSNVTMTTYNIGGLSGSSSITADFHFASRNNSSVFVNCYLFELAIFNGTKDATWMTQANAYTLAKWGL